MGRAIPVILSMSKDDTTQDKLCLGVDTCLPQAGPITTCGYDGKIIFSGELVLVRPGPWST